MAVILVTNDDGVHAPGLAVLAEALEPLGEVWVVAPEREQSACGHALTLHRPLRPHQWGERRFAVNGTPSDCVNLAVLGFLPERPVLVASGVNHGSNLGDDVTYSGTVSAAMEGTLLGVPSIAVSLVDGGDLAAAGRVARLVATRLLVEGLPAKTLLNVNVPREGPRGLRFTRLGHRVYSEKVVEQVDPRGRTHYWLGGGPAQWEALEGTDMGAVHEGFVAVTPLHLDLTNHRALAHMADWAGALDGQVRRDAARPAPAPARRPRPRKTK
jgi:5'-nucleotidase